MKKLFLPAGLMLCITWLQAQQPATKEQLAVQQTIVKLFDALSVRDTVALRTYSTADITFYEYGERWTMDTLIAKAVKPGVPADFKRTNSFEFIQTATNQSMAWATYHLQSVIIKDGKQTTMQWLETVVLVKEDKRWKIQHLHSTLLKRS